MKTVFLGNPMKKAENFHILEVPVSIGDEHPTRAVRKAFRGRLSDFVISKIDPDTLLVFVTTKESLSASFERVSLTNLSRPIRDEIKKYWQYQMARVFALERHGDQKYSSLNLPYYFHLRQTEKVVDRFLMALPAGKSLELKMAALLHDILEDTQTTRQELLDRFGDEVTSIVDSVTKTREEHTPQYEADYYAKISQNSLAVYIKIADKCANAKQTLKVFSEWHAKRIIEGHKTFQDYTYSTIPDSSLKLYLDGLVRDLENHHG